MLKFGQGLRLVAFAPCWIDKYPLGPAAGLWADAVNQIDQPPTAAAVCVGAEVNLPFELPCDFLYLAMGSVRNAANCTLSVLLAPSS